jgi:hypothetical protein
MKLGGISIEDIDRIARWMEMPLWEFLNLYVTDGHTLKKGDLMVAIMETTIERPEDSLVLVQKRDSDTGERSWLCFYNAVQTPGATAFDAVVSAVLRGTIHLAYF